MEKQILIINSGSDSERFLTEIFEELPSELSFTLLTSAPGGNLSTYFRQKHWQIKKIVLGPDFGRGKAVKLLFIFFFPLFFFSLLVRLSYYKIAKKTETLVCLGMNEKLITACPARILGIKTVWLESPNEKTFADGSLGRRFRRCAKKAMIICFNRLQADRLCRLLKSENVKIIEPGIRLNQFRYQDNIFNNLAQLEAGQKKYFTLGTIADLNDPYIVSHFEILFAIVKKCLSAAPNLQLIIIGDGAERKRLIWLAKKMEIESLVWFVGKQQHLKKWLDGFDLFLVIADRPRLNDLLITLKAMASELPVIAQADVGLEEIVENGKTGFLLSMRDDDKITEKIISLRRDKYLLKRLGTAGRERVEKNHDIARSVREFEKILYNMNP